MSLKDKPCFRDILAAQELGPRKIDFNPFLPRDTIHQLDIARRLTSVQTSVWKA